VALLTVEVFALAPDPVPVLDQNQQFDVFVRLTDALTALTARRESVLVMGSSVDTYDNGALVHVLCLAPCGDVAADAVAEHLEIAMTTDTKLFDRWSLAAGRTSVLCSDN
jgi:hypothetical protein